MFTISCLRDNFYILHSSGWLTFPISRGIQPKCINELLKPFKIILPTGKFIHSFLIAHFSISFIQRWEFIKENKKVRKKKNTFSTKKKESFFFFSWSLSWSRPCFLSFLAVIVFSWSLSWSRACFLSFFFFSWSLTWSKACFLPLLFYSQVQLAWLIFIQDYKYHDSGNYASCLSILFTSLSMLSEPIFSQTALCSFGKNPSWNNNLSPLEHQYINMFISINQFIYPFSYLSIH